MRHFFSTLFWLLLLVAPLAAQQPRYALVIGNGNYEFASLGQTPINDANAMRDALTQAGFKIDFYTDLDEDNLSIAITTFCRKIKDSGGVALFYYSGHGVQYDNHNYLVPIGAEMTDEDEIERVCVPINRIISRMKDAGTATNIIFLDACRALPVSRVTKSLTKGLAKEPYDVPELFVAYATAPGSTATVRGEGGLSLYTSQLLKHLKTPGLVLEAVLKNTFRDVLDKSNKQQRPDFTSNLTSDFYFFPISTPSTERAPARPAQSTTYRVGTPESKSKKAEEVSKANNMVFVKGGTFTMGCKKGRDQNCLDYEKPAHNVTLSDFYIGKYEVTNAQFVQFLNAKGNQTEGGKKWIYLDGSYVRIIKSDSTFKYYIVDKIHPVVYVTWYGAKAYCAWLSEQSGQQYRLPTEAEWEYAARGGDLSKGYKYAGSNTLADVGWYESNADGTSAVGNLKPNELGLHDMSGNVWEWCSDWYSDNYYEQFRKVTPVNPQGPYGGDHKVIRGGWYSDYNGDNCESAARAKSEDSYGWEIGFRVVRAVAGQ